MTNIYKTKKPKQKSIHIWITLKKTIMLVMYLSHDMAQSIPHPGIHSNFTWYVFDDARTDL